MGGVTDDIYCLHLFTGVGCLFVVGGVRVLLWIWLRELSRATILISAGLSSNATNSKSTLISSDSVRWPQLGGGSDERAQTFNYSICAHKLQTDVGRKVNVVPG